MGHPRNHPTLCWSLRAESLPLPLPQWTPFPGGLAGGAPGRAAQGPTDKSVQNRWRGARGVEAGAGRTGSRARGGCSSPASRSARSVSGRPRGSRFARGAGRGRRPQVAPLGREAGPGPPAQKAEGAEWRGGAPGRPSLAQARARQVSRPASGPEEGYCPLTRWARTPALRTLKDEVTSSPGPRASGAHRSRAASPAMLAGDIGLEGLPPKEDPAAREYPEAAGRGRGGGGSLSTARWGPRGWQLSGD